MAKHPQLYSDLLAFYQAYWAAHKNFPKSFRATTGEQILNELTAALKLIVLASGHSQRPDGRANARGELEETLTTLDVIRGLLTLAWSLKFISHPQMAALNKGLDGLKTQTANWRDWLGRNIAEK